MSKIENSAKAIVVVDRRLLVLRYEDTTYDLGTWYSLPGGRQVYGEDLAETLKRECLEETGFLVDVKGLAYIREYIHKNHQVASAGRDQHKVEFMFLCELCSAQKGQTELDKDQTAIEWISLETVSDLNIYPTQLKSLRWHTFPKLGGPVYWGDTM